MGEDNDTSPPGIAEVLGRAVIGDDEWEVAKRRGTKRAVREGRMKAAGNVVAFIVFMALMVTIFILCLAASVKLWRWAF